MRTCRAGERTLASHDFIEIMDWLIEEAKRGPDHPALQGPWAR